MEWIFWLALGIVALSFQLFALSARRNRGQLTWSIRWLIVRLWGRVVVLPAFAWLTMHWFVQPYLPGSSVAWHIAAIVFGSVAAFVLDYSEIRTATEPRRKLDDSGGG